jgi:hypothetical protein
VFDVRSHAALLDATVSLGLNLHQPKNSRKDVGDKGDMFALAARDSFSIYAPTKWPGMRKLLQRFSVRVADFLQQFSPSNLEDIHQAEKKKWKARRKQEKNPTNKKELSSTERCRRQKYKRSKQ